MRILQINSFCGTGSTGRIATDIHQALTGAGHESYIAFGRDEAVNCNNSIKIGNKMDNYLHVAKTRLLDKHGFGSVSATRRFIDQVERLNPDIIHLHNIHGYYINLEILFDYIKRFKKPVVWTLHDCWPFTGHCAYFDYVKCNRWQSECHTCPQRLSYPASFMLDNSDGNFHKKRSLFSDIENMIIVTPSNWLANVVTKSFLSAYPTRVINNGVDLHVFAPVNSDFREKHGITGKFVILGVAGVWDRRKGYKYFLELSKDLRDDEVIVLVGLTDRQLADLPKNVIGIKRTNDIRELAEVYSSADVYVNPTLEDNFPTTNLEALACGTPVVTFDTGGSIESVGEDCGFIVGKGDIGSLSDSISSIKTTGKSTYQDKCTRRATLYNKVEKYQEYIHLYLDFWGKVNYGADY